MKSHWPLVMSACLLATACRDRYPIEGSWRTTDRPFACEDGASSDLELEVRDCADDDNYYNTGPSCLGGGQLCECEFMFERGNGPLSVGWGEEGAFFQIGACGLEILVSGMSTNDNGALDLDCDPQGDSMTCEQSRPDLGCFYNTDMLACGTGLQLERVE